MKPRSLGYSAIICALLGILPSCDLTNAQKATLKLNAAKDANAFAFTYLTTMDGAAAALAAGAQVLKNHTPVTAPKNPPVDPVNP